MVQYLRMDRGADLARAIAGDETNLNGFKVASLLSTHISLKIWFK